MTRAGLEINEKRWTFAVGDEVGRPKGPDRALEEAVKLVGPFAYRTNEEAEKNGRTKKSDDTSYPISEESARKSIGRLAEEFLNASYLEKDAPRIKHVIESLQSVEEACGHLASKLESLDDICCLELSQAGHVGTAGDEASKEIQRLFGEDALPRPTDSSDDPERVGSLARMSRELERRAAITLENLHARFSDGGIADKGGQTNFYKTRAGSAQRNFLIHAYDIFEFFKPGEATSTSGKAFFNFVHLAYEYATGIDSEDEAKLAHLLSTVVGRLRNKERQRTAWRTISDRISKLPPAHPDWTILTQKERELREKAFEIDEWLYPHHARDRAAVRRT